MKIAQMAAQVSSELSEETWGGVRRPGLNVM